MIIDSVDEDDNGDNDVDENVGDGDPCTGLSRGWPIHVILELSECQRKFSQVLNYKGDVSKSNHQDDFPLKFVEETEELPCSKVVKTQFAHVDTFLEKENHVHMLKDFQRNQKNWPQDLGPNSLSERVFLDGSTLNLAFVIFFTEHPRCAIWYYIRWYDVKIRCIFWPHGKCVHSSSSNVCSRFLRKISFYSADVSKTIQEN